MTTWQIVRMLAGLLILVSLALGTPGSPLFLNQWWLALSAFVGLNLLQSAFTGWCPSERILRRLGFTVGA